jgi:hypothetical protein
MTRMFLGIPMWADEERDELAGARALLGALQRDLCQAGFTVREDLDSWDDHGPRLVVEHEGASIWCMVQASEDWLIQCWPQSGFIDRLKGRDVARTHREVMDAIVSALSRQRLLESAEWVSEEELRAC